MEPENVVGHLVGGLVGHLFGRLILTCWLAEIVSPPVCPLVHCQVGRLASRLVALLVWPIWIDRNCGRSARNLFAPAIGLANIAAG